MSPELIDPEQFGSKKRRPTKTTDCYAFGMVIYETISGNLPFHEHADLAVLVKVLKGERPPRGARFTNSLWKMLESCWAPQPNDRPSVEDVLQCLEAVSISSEAPSGVDGKTEGYSDWDSASSLPSVGHDRGADTGSFPDLSCLSVGSLAHDPDIDMDRATGTANMIPTLPPPVSPPIPHHAKGKPTSGHETHDNTPPQVKFGGLSTAIPEGVAPRNSGSGATRHPTRKIGTKGRIAQKVQRSKGVSSFNGPVPGSSNVSENTTDSGSRKGGNGETSAPPTVHSDYRTTNTPFLGRVQFGLRSVSSVRCPGFFVRSVADLLITPIASTARRNSCSTRRGSWKPPSRQQFYASPTTAPPTPARLSTDHRGRHGCTVVLRKIL